MRADAQKAASDRTLSGCFRSGRELGYGARMAEPPDWFIADEYEYVLGSSDAPRFEAG
jgi:hypothetical protein